MFLFEALSAGQVFMWFAVLAALMLLNELARANKWAALALFLVLPIILTFTVWIKTAVPSTSVGTWFHWMMFVMTYPSFVDMSAYAVKSSHSTTALWVVSGLSLVVNVVVTGYHVYRLIKNKVNPFKAEVYTDLQAYKKIAELKGKRKRLTIKKASRNTAWEAFYFAQILIL